MMDVSLHPGFASNQMVYLAYVDQDYHLSVVRFRLEENTISLAIFILRKDILPILNV